MRKRLYEILEGGAADRAARLANSLLMLLIVANVAAVIAESEQSIFVLYDTWFQVFETVSVAIFTVEYLLRLWVSVEAPGAGAVGWRARLRHVLSPMALVDLLAIAPFYLGAFFQIDTRFLRSLRLLRVFKLTRHSASMDLLLAVIRKELGTVLSAMFIMVIIIIVAASGIYLIERDSQPQAFDSIPKAMWWAAVTLTTVGYGDVVPVTPFGKLFGFVITVAGVGMVALPAGILASGFSGELQKRRETYRMQVRRTLASGTASGSETLELERQRAVLGVSRDYAQLVVSTEREAAEAEAETVCPHCGKPLGGHGRKA